MMRAAFAVLFMAAACSPADRGGRETEAVEPASTPAVPADTAPEDDATPPDAADVRVVANPPPPFTYWAPAGSVIRNHGNPGLWTAFKDGKPVATYFGDACGASRRQGWIGQSVDALPPDASGKRRVFERGQAVTQDLQPDRLNVAYDGETRRVVEVACY